MDNSKKEKPIKFIHWIAGILILIAIPYLIVFILDFGLNKFQPVAVVFTSLMYLVVGTYFLWIIQDIVSSVKDRLDTLERVYGKKR